VQELPDLGGDLFRRGAPVQYRAVAAHDCDADRAEFARFPDECVGQVRVGLQQVAHRPGVVAGHFVVRMPCILHLLDILGRPPDRFAIDDISDLAQGEPVSFDGGGCVNRENPIELAQLQHVAGLFLADLDALKQCVNIADLFVPPRIFRIKTSRALSRSCPFRLEEALVRLVVNGINVDARPGNKLL